MDTADKRASAVHIGLPFRGMLPVPDGSIGAGDRAQAGLMYRGIIDEGGTPPEPATNNDWLIVARRRGRR